MKIINREIDFIYQNIFQRLHLALEDQTTQYDNVLRKILEVVFSNYETLEKADQGVVEKEENFEFNLNKLPIPALLKIKKFMKECPAVS